MYLSIDKEIFIAINWQFVLKPVGAHFWEWKCEWDFRSQDVFNSVTVTRFLGLYHVLF